MNSRPFSYRAHFGPYQVRGTQSGYSFGHAPGLEERHSPSKKLVMHSRKQHEGDCNTPVLCSCSHLLCSCSHSSLPSRSTKESTYCTWCTSNLDNDDDDDDSRHSDQEDDNLRPLLELLFYARRKDGVLVRRTQRGPGQPTTRSRCSSTHPRRPRGTKSMNGFRQRGRAVESPR